MSKRIFTKYLSGQSTIITGAITSENALASWLTQEDIEVIGAELTVVSATPAENDGFAHCNVELSQVGIFGQDGAILRAVAGEGWNTTPAGIDQSNANAVVTFPAGFAVPVKEEGYLYINSQGYGKTAGGSVFIWGAIIYYTKGK